MAGVVIIGAIAVFLAGLAVGILLATIMMHRDDRRSRLIRRVRGLRPGNMVRRPALRRRDLDARISQPDGGLCR
jgi:hypothetical protein